MKEKFTHSHKRPKAYNVLETFKALQFEHIAYISILTCIENTREHVFTLLLC